MDEIHQIAEAYYDAGTDRERCLYIDFFSSMDQDGNRRVDFSEFQQFVSQEGRQELGNRYFFNQLDRDGNGGLDFREVRSLYYIMKSGRPICGQCKVFITGLYFTCTECFNKRLSPFCLCINCFRSKQNSGHIHGLGQFLDNFVLLESKRKLAITAAVPPNASQPLQPSSSRAIVSYCPNPALTPSRWSQALRVFEAGFALANVAANCVIQ